MFVRSLQVSVGNWRRGYSILERPEAFDTARSEALTMLILLGSFLVLMILGLPVAIAMAVSSLLYILVTGIVPDVIAGPADDRRRRELPAARRALLHPGRQPDEHRRRHRAHLQLRRGAGRLDEGRARAR